MRRSLFHEFPGLDWFRRERGGDVCAPAVLRREGANSGINVRPLVLPCQLLWVYERIIYTSESSVRHATSWKLVLVSRFAAPPSSGVTRRACLWNILEKIRRWEVEEAKMRT
jgi:hypothetical protein